MSDESRRQHRMLAGNLDGPALAVQRDDVVERAVGGMGDDYTISRDALTARHLADVWGGNHKKPRATGSTGYARG